MFSNYAILAAILVCFHGHRVCQNNFQYILLSETHSTVWAKTIALAMEFKNKPYLSISIWGVSP